MFSLVSALIWLRARTTRKDGEEPCLDKVECFRHALAFLTRSGAMESVRGPTFIPVIGLFMRFLASSNLGIAAA